ncbi:hypothetical protein ACFL5V_05535 [Fibrobacterota bacterium]
MTFPIRIQRLFLLLSMLMSGFCGIIAELSLFNLANSLIGGVNIVLTYTMGVMMFCMGVGALTVRLRVFRGPLHLFFVGIESILSIIVGVCVPVIYFLSAWFPHLSIAWVLGFSAIIGYLIGFEIPLILLINERLKQPLQDNSALVFFADYVGSLIAFILFSHYMLVTFGLAYTAIIGAGLNWLIAVLTAVTFGREIQRFRLALGLITSSGLVLGALLINCGTFMAYTEQLHYRDKIVLSKRTPYQKLIVTDSSLAGNPRYNHIHRERPRKELASVKLDSVTVSLKEFKPFQGKRDIRMFINGGLQFSTVDEHYYHEMMVHPAMFLSQRAETILIGGGGDGMALREVLKHPFVKEVLVIDIDPEITALFTVNPLFCGFNDSAYHDPRVKVLNADMFTWLKNSGRGFDVIILDFPDPHHDEVAKLYSLQMYRYAHLSLNPGGLLVTQSTSPYFNRRAFLIIARTMERVFPGSVLSYKVAMPAFGLWGFQLASKEMSGQELKRRLEGFAIDVPVGFINREIVQSSYRWSRVTLKGYDTMPVNDWLKPVLVKAYVSGR